MNLYDVAVEGQELERLLTESEGELTPEMEARFEAFIRGGKEKINAALCVRKNMEAEAKACKEEADRLYERGRALEARRATLSQWILAAVDFGFGGKVKTAFFTAYGQTSADHNGYSLAADVDIVELHKRDPEIVRLKAELNVAALNAIVKDGGAMPPEVNVEPIPGKRFLQVR